MGMKEDDENEDGMNDLALLFYTDLSVGGHCKSPS